jgi:hypothetical protein
VNKSVLLLQLLSDGQSKFCSAGPKRDDFRIQQLAKGQARESLARDVY